MIDSLREYPNGARYKSPSAWPSAASLCARRAAYPFLAARRLTHWSHAASLTSSYGFGAPAHELHAVRPLTYPKIADCLRNLFGRKRDHPSLLSSRISARKMSLAVGVLAFVSLLASSAKGQDCTKSCTLTSSYKFVPPAGVNGFTVECGSSAGGTGTATSGTVLNNGGSGVVATATFTGVTTTDSFYFFLGTTSDGIYGGQSSNTALAGNGASPLGIFSQNDNTGYIWILGGGAGGSSINKGGDAGFDSGAPGAGSGAGQGSVG